MLLAVAWKYWYPVKYFHLVHYQEQITLILKLCSRRSERPPAQYRVLKIPESAIFSFGSQRTQVLSITFQKDPEASSGKPMDHRRLRPYLRFSTETRQVVRRRYETLCLMITKCCIPCSARRRRKMQDLNHLDMEGVVNLWLVSNCLWGLLGRSHFHKIHISCPNDCITNFPSNIQRRIRYSLGKGPFLDTCRTLVACSLSESRSNPRETICYRLNVDSQCVR